MSSWLVLPWGSWRWTGFTPFHYFNANRPKGYILCFFSFLCPRPLIPLALNIACIWKLIQTMCRACWLREVLLISRWFEEGHSSLYASVVISMNLFHLFNLEPHTIISADVIGSIPRKIWLNARIKAFEWNSYTYYRDA